MFRKSIDEGKIPDVLKLAYVTPIHNGGSRQKPEQYRLVSLTSHVMKVFERVIKKKIIAHLKEKEKINDGQHRFVPGRSTQTQLLCHYNGIYETLTVEVGIESHVFKNKRTPFFIKDFYVRKPKKKFNIR